MTNATGAYGSEGFSYDANGNRTAAGSVGYMYAANSNRISTIHSSGVVTNAAGNITHLPTIGSAPVQTFTYNAADRLLTAPGLSYVYDGLGRRVIKSDTGQRYINYGAPGTDQDGMVLEETDNTGSPSVDYIYLNGMPVAVFQPNGGLPGTLSFLHTDRLGTPRLATAANQSNVWSATQADPWDNSNLPTGMPAISHELRLPGQEAETAMTSIAFNHNGWRDYLPGLGRYIESDPIGLKGGLNAYAYAGGNPVKWTDFSGLYLHSLPSTGVIDPNIGKQCFAQSPVCPQSEPKDDVGWVPYDNVWKAWWQGTRGFHGHLPTYLYGVHPDNGSRQECTYDPNGNLITPNMPYPWGDLAGTADTYGPDNLKDHTWYDDGGTFNLNSGTNHFFGPLGASIYRQVFNPRPPQR